MLTWGDGSFTNQFPQVIRKLTVAEGYLTPRTNIPTTISKNLNKKRIHSKILAHQVLTMLTDDARKVIKCQSNQYTWKDMNGLDEEMDGMTIVALILKRLCSHHKVDM